MDPIFLTVIAVVVLILILRIFFGLAKFAFKLAIIVVLAIVLWRLLVVRG